MENTEVEQKLEPEYVVLLRDNARNWLKEINKEIASLDNKKILNELVEFFNSNFNNPKYNQFIVHSSALGFLCRALVNNISSVDLLTNFGKHWFQIVRVCVPLLDKVRSICVDTMSCDDNNKNMEDYIGSYDDIYYEVFAKLRSGRRRHDRYSNQVLPKASVITLVKEILDRLRLFAYIIPNRRRQSSNTRYMSEKLDELCDWLPYRVSHMITFTRKDDTEGSREVHDEPYLTICKDFLKVAIATKRLNSLQTREQEQEQEQDNNDEEYKLQRQQKKNKKEKYNKK